MEILNRIGQTLEDPLVNIPGLSVSPMAIIQAILILLAAILFSKLLRRFLRRNVFSRSRISHGVQESVSRVLHYVVMVLGMSVVLQHLGIDLTAFAALGAVLMVGIGFGLQNITSNFISGLILLFERPIQVGDMVEAGGVLGLMKAINARSTTVETFDNVSIIVPNSQFISESVTNWSHRDPRTRVHVRVGVAYGSDVDKVRETLLEAGVSHPEVLSDPEPRVVFYEFGDSSLNFDLLVWIKDPTNQLNIRSDLHFAIVRAFRENQIEIPFPQRDLHIRSSVPLTAVSSRSATTDDSAGPFVEGSEEGI